MSYLFIIIIFFYNLRNTNKKMIATILSVVWTSPKDQISNIPILREQASTIAPSQTKS